VALLDDGDKAGSAIIALISRVDAAVTSVTTTHPARIAVIDRLWFAVRPEEGLRDQVVAGVVFPGRPGDTFRIAAWLAVRVLEGAVGHVAAIVVRPPDVVVTGADPHQPPFCVEIACLDLVSPSVEFPGEPEVAQFMGGRLAIDAKVTLLDVVAALVILPGIL